VGKVAIEGNFFNEFNNGDMLIDYISNQGLQLKGNQNLTGEKTVTGKTEGLDKVL